MKTRELVCIRHGESVWNQENRFTGWCDVDLSAKGQVEAKDAGRLLKEKGFVFDYAYASYLKRSIKTLGFILEEMDALWLPVEKSWRLNERHYGALQGLNKAEVSAEYGEDQVLKWRRSYDTLPPLMEESDEGHPLHDVRYKGIEVDDLPAGESMAVCLERVRPFWKETVWPRIVQGDKVLLVAHGNSIRALLKDLQDLSEEEVLKLNIPTGVPVHITFDDTGHAKNLEYIGDQDAIQDAMSRVANQGKK